LITLTIAATIGFVSLLNCYFVQSDVLIVDEWNDPPEWNYTATLRAGFWQKCASKWWQCHCFRETCNTILPASLPCHLDFWLVLLAFYMLALRPITCKPYSKNRIRILCSAVVFAFVSQVVTFAMFGREICKENDCFLGGGGIVSIIAAVLYLISAVTV
jgi:hypothetical protein